MEPGDGQAQGPGICQAKLLLHQPFSEAPPADDGAAVVVLDGARKNLAGGGRPFIDEHGHFPVPPFARLFCFVIRACDVLALGVHHLLALF